MPSDSFFGSDTVIVNIRSDDAYQLVSQKSHYFFFYS